MACKKIFNGPERSSPCTLLQLRLMSHEGRRMGRGAAKKIEIYQAEETREIGTKNGVRVN
jgi:hypothetical protein